MREPPVGQRRRLLFVGTNRGGGGIESYFITLAISMADAGWDVSAAVWPDEPIHRALAADPRIQLFPLRFERRNDGRASRDLHRIAREVRPDRMIGMYAFEFWPLAIVARLLGIKLVLFEHVERRLHPLKRYLLPAFVERMLVPSEYLARHLVRIGFPAAKLAVLPNPLDTERFRPEPARRAASRADLGFGVDDVVIGFVGRLEPSKGVHTLADAFDLAMRERADVRALWVGSGLSGDALRTRIDGSPFADRHRWIPWTDDVRPAIAAMDVLTLPSTGKETFGRVLVEGEATGIPVIGSRLGGIPEALEDGLTGLVCAPGDAADWARAIVVLAADPALRDRMGRRGMELARTRFDARAVAARFATALTVGMHTLDVAPVVDTSEPTDLATAHQTASGGRGAPLPSGLT